MISKLMVPPLFDEVAIFTDLGQRIYKKGGFFLIFEPILQAGFSDKMLALCPCFWLFGCCTFTIYRKKWLSGKFIWTKVATSSLLFLHEIKNCRAK